MSRSEGGVQSPQEGRLNIISAKEDGGADTKKKDTTKKETKRSRDVAAAAGGESYTPDVSQAAFPFFVARAISFPCFYNIIRLALII